MKNKTEKKPKPADLGTGAAAAAGRALQTRSQRIEAAINAATQSALKKK